MSSEASAEWFGKGEFTSISVRESTRNRVYAICQRRDVTYDRLIRELLLLSDRLDDGELDD